jgi:glycosyltransferase involved in cell wall biosynthesis
MTVVKEINSKKISILWISFFLDNPSLLNILRQFAELGHEVTLISVQTKNVPRIENAQVRIISVPLRHVPLISPVMFTIFLFFYLPIFIIISKLDVIIMEPYVHILSAFPQLLISRFKKVKSVLDVRSTPVETTGFRGFQQKFWFSVSILTAKKLFDGMTIITPLMKKEVCSLFNIDPAKVGVWTSGVSDSLFNPQNLISESAELRKQLGLTGKFVVFYHGVFSATRGLTETIKAVKVLKHRYPNVVFFLLGTGPIVPMLKTLVREDSLQDNVFIHNPIEQSKIPKFIGMGDVCIVPLPYHSYWRFQCPLKLLEYLAMEKVVIVTDIPAHRSIIGEEKCGIYTCSAEPIEIAKSIEYAYHNKEQLEQWGKSGRPIIQEKYTWEKVSRDLENYLLSIK